MSKDIEWYEEGIEDALDDIEPKPDPLYYDSYMDGYRAGKEIKAQPLWMERYSKGLEDGKKNIDPALPKSNAYMRGYGDGIVWVLEQLEVLDDVSTES